MAKSRWLYKQIKARQKYPAWLKLSKGESPTYTLRYETNTKQIMVFRGNYFSLPRGNSKENPELVDVEKAATADGLTGDYIDFLLEGTEDRFQTTRSLLSEVFGKENPEKSM